MTHLRQIMLEELKRRNYAGSLFALTSTQLNASVNTFIVGPISLARSRFASIRPCCSPVGSWPRTP